MKFLSTLFYLCMIVLMCFFGFLNPIKVTLDYYWGSVTWPLGIIVIIGFIVGGLLGRMIGSLSGRRVMKKKMLNKFSKIAGSQDPKTNVINK